MSTIVFILGFLLLAGAGALVMLFIKAVRRWEGKRGINGGPKPYSPWVFLVCKVLNGLAALAILVGVGGILLLLVNMLG